MSGKKLGTFDTFVKALASLQTEDSALLGWPRNRVALTHALAFRLKEALEAQDSDLQVDMGVQVSRSHRVLAPDILVHDRASRRTLALVCRNEYLKEEEQSELLALRDAAACDLVMAIAFLPSKSYCLLYRVNGERLEYHHFDRNTLTSELTRIVGRDEQVSKDQLSFGKMR